MKMGKLYTLKEQDIAVAPFHEMVTMGVFDPPRYPDNSIVIGPDAMMAPLWGEKIQVPMHTVMRVHPRRESRVWGPSENRIVPEVIYFAVEPDLKDILEAPFRKELDELKADLSRFNGKRWWKRAWLAARGPVCAKETRS